MRNKSNKMTEIEKQQWNDLYQYVKKEILLYDESQSIPSSLVLRLKGLAKGKYIENKNIEDRAKYSYEVVLYTFQICKPKIINAILGKDFNSEQGKFSYICKIVENSLNDVYMRLKQAKKTEEKTEGVNTENLSYKGAEYANKTEKIKNDRLNELW